MMLLVELIGGLMLLVLGAEAMVHGSIRLSRSLGVSSLVVGLTAMAFGTSVPELFVSLIASLRGEPGVALGNVIGSNVFNIAVTLALAALIRPLRIELRLLRLEIPFIFLIGLLFAGMAVDGAISRLDGGLLLLVFLGYMLYVRRMAVEDPARLRGAAEGARPPARHALRVAVLITATGLVVLAFSARWLVDTATELAQVWGVSERVIALTLIAGGTSLPEMAASLAAIARRESDLAVGNLLGSNIFNTLAVLGTAAVARPLAPTSPFLGLDMLVMLLTVLLLIPLLARTGRRLSRWEGAVLLLIYAGYMGLLIMRPGGT